MGITKHLNFDMTALVDVFFDEDAVVAKAGSGLAGRTCETFLQLRIVPGDTHPLAAATGRRFDHHRIANIVGHFQRVFVVCQGAVIARRNRYTGFLSKKFGLDLIAHRPDGVRRRPDKDQTGSIHSFRKRGILGQEAKTRMDSLRAGIFCRLQDAFLDQIAFGRGRAADGNGLVRHDHCLGSSIRL